MTEPTTTHQGLEHIRRKPGMYIGGTDQRALNCCVLELIANAIEEHLGGRGSLIAVTIHDDGSLSVADEGGGISVITDPIYKIPFIELALTTLQIPTSSLKKPYRVFGLCGVGTKCVNAVSEWMHVNTVWDGNEYRIGFSRGRVTNTLTKMPNPGMTRGTIVRFKPDAEIFKSREFDRNFLAARLNHLAVLHPGLAFVLTDERPNPANRSLTALYHYPGGLAEFLKITDLGRYRHPPDPLEFKGDLDGATVAVGFQFSEAHTFSILSFVNSSPTIKGGTHVEGFLRGLADGLNDSVRSDSPIMPSDLRSGLTAFVAVWLDDPKYGGTAKDELINPEIEIAVRDLTTREVQEWARTSGDHAKRLFEWLAENH
jgi:DNA gyrase subunit B